ncbi:MAG TPA: hypothetical protein VK438_09665 [Xanthobacteraceae bacterium]|nr:hypothetical protein [Xanthobacteraceae bacterium]
MSTKNSDRPKTTDDSGSKRQIDKFRQAAREHQVDEDENKFNDALRRVAKAPAKSDGA